MGTYVLTKNNITNWLKRAGVLVVTRLLFKDGIQLNGLPAPRADPQWRLFALPPHRSDRFNASHPASSMS